MLITKKQTISSTKSVSQSSKIMQASKTRSNNSIWLIGYPSETISGARLPSGGDIMRNFIFYHTKEKLTIADSASKVYNNLLPFWVKSRLPTRQKHHVIKQIKDVYGKQVSLMKHMKRSNVTDQKKQKEYSEELERLFDISHANSDQLIKNEEDKKFLKLQQESRTGVIGSVDRKLAIREAKGIQRKIRKQHFAKKVAQQQTVRTAAEDEEESSSADNDDIESDTDCDIISHQNRKRKQCLSQSVASVLDRTGTSVRKSTMIAASILNEAGCSTETVVLSKSTVHRQRQKHRKTAAEIIKENYISNSSKSIVHWDSKLLPDISGQAGAKVNRLPVILTCLVDGSTKLLGVPILSEDCAAGQGGANAVFDQLQSWRCNSQVVGMCFDTTASNTGRHNGVCTLLEQAVDRNLLWLACRHHMLEVLLADTFKACLGPSTGPDILLFKRFRDSWNALRHEPLAREAPLIAASDEVKSFIQEQLMLTHPRDDYLELLQLSAMAVGLDLSVTIRKPGAMHRARWMAKAIYSLKMDLLLAGNEKAMHVTAKELRGLRRFNKFVISIYLQSWYTCKSAVDAPFNDIQILQRIRLYDDDVVRKIGIKMMQRHSWYLSPELATLALFSDKLNSDEKVQLVHNMLPDRQPHLVESLPDDLASLNTSHSFFETTGLDDSFLSEPVTSWSELDSYNQAASLAKNIACINDCAERGVALIQDFNLSTRDEVQKQYLLQIVEKHRQNFKTCNREQLMNI